MGDIDIDVDLVFKCGCCVGVGGIVCFDVFCCCCEDDCYDICENVS